MPFAHVLIYVRSTQASKLFYEKVLKSLNYVVTHDSEKMVGFASGGGSADFYLALDDTTHPESKKAHLAFQASSKEQVHDFHAAALEAGANSNGEPGPRPYLPGYYASFVSDPDGYNVECLFFETDTT